LISISKAIERWGRFDARNNRKDETVSVRELREFIEPAFMRFKYNPEVRGCDVSEGESSGSSCNYDFREYRNLRLGYSSWKPSIYRRFTREQCQDLGQDALVGVQCLEAIFSAIVVGAFGVGLWEFRGKCIDVQAIAPAMNIKSYVYLRRLGCEGTGIPRYFDRSIQVIPNPFAQVTLIQNPKSTCLENIYVPLMRPL
jgi:hypothetical protein